ncbi:MAG: VWA domain-containing protein [Bryobacteraceae bacterium]
MKLPRRDKEKGSVSVIFLLTLVFVLIPLTGLAIDATVLYVVKVKLSAAVDAAALAGGRSLNSGQGTAKATAQTYFSANFPANYWNSVASALVTVNLNQSCNSAPQCKVRTVTVQGQATVPLIFMRIFGFTQTIVADTGQASRRDVNIILVLDRSGSMQASGSCGPMKAAAQEFVDMFSSGTDTLGLITFMQSANLDFAPTTNFQPGMNTVIGQLICTSSTATADTLHLAYQQILAIGQPEKLNVIVLFTDGIPNGVRATYPGTATTKCQAGVPLTGSISEGSPTSGVWDATGVPDWSQPKGVIPVPGCAFATNPNAVDQDVAYIPDADLWGNSTRCCFITPPFDASNHIPVNTFAAINAASINAADNQARTIRNDRTYQPIIYAIGYSVLINKPLLLSIANDPSSPTYDPSVPAGLFVYAPDKSALSSAFNTIASQILRLSQ